MNRCFESDCGKVKNASEIRLVEHPLNETFLKFCRKEGKQPNKRTARCFLQKYPQFRELED